MMATRTPPAVLMSAVKLSHGTGCHHWRHSNPQRTAWGCSICPMHVRCRLQLCCTAQLPSVGASIHVMCRQLRCPRACHLGPEGECNVAPGQLGCRVRRSCLLLLPCLAGTCGRTEHTGLLASCAAKLVRAGLWRSHLPVHGLQPLRRARQPIDIRLRLGYRSAFGAPSAHATAPVKLASEGCALYTSMQIYL